MLLFFIGAGAFTSRVLPSDGSRIMRFMVVFVPKVTVARYALVKLNQANTVAKVAVKFMEVEFFIFRFVSFDNGFAPMPSTVEPIAETCRKFHSVLSTKVFSV